jgi:hypothetical protein
MSGLTKKAVVADRTLATLLGVAEGELVSYAQLSKGLHEYIKINDLKNPQRIQSAAIRVPQAAATQPVATSTGKAPSVEHAPTKKCKDCNLEIPVEAVFCDLCGASQQ